MDGTSVRSPCARSGTRGRPQRVPDQAEVGIGPMAADGPRGGRRGAGEAHVTVPKTASGRSPVGVVHHGALGAQDVTVVGTIPCTRPARTLLDSAAVLRLERFCDVLDEALCRPLTDVDALGAAMARASRAPGRKGTANLVRALEVWTPGRRPRQPSRDAPRSSSADVGIQASGASGCSSRSAGRSRSERGSRLDGGASGPRVRR